MNIGAHPIKIKTGHILDGKIRNICFCFVFAIDQIFGKVRNTFSGVFLNFIIDSHVKPSYPLLNQNGLMES